MLEKPCLYLVAVPIGNPDDITLRAIQTLKDADVIIGEERSTTEKILKRYGVVNKEILLLNEHNEATEALSIYEYITSKNISVALISEAGTPCIADPGATLVDICHRRVTIYGVRVKIVPIPGVSSIMATLMISGLIKEPFKYIGFLPVKDDQRRLTLKNLAKENMPVIIMETPYRRRQLLSLIAEICGKDRQIVFAYKLTYPQEMILKCSVAEVIEKTDALPKGEFVVVVL